MATRRSGRSARAKPKSPSSPPRSLLRSKENRPAEPVQHGPRVRAAGRIVLERKKGKLIFIDIRDWTGQIQLLVGRNQIGEENWALAECFDLGDLIGVDGELKRTRTGELSIFVEKLHLLTKTLDPPPEKYHGLTDPEMRQRLRHLDLTYGDGVLQRFVNRTRIVQSIRSTLAGQGFVEIEGPTLHSIAGGAAARPFKTHHNALDMPLYLRIALELHLKRLLVGGMERVYELGRVYRNEGISPKHNPEFTMLEAYQAYGDYRSMMDLTEQLIVGALDSIGAGRQTQWGEATVDFTPPFARHTYDELFTQHAGVPAGDRGGREAVGRFDRLGDGRQASGRRQERSLRAPRGRSAEGAGVRHGLSGQHLPVDEAQDVESGGGRTF